MKIRYPDYYKKFQCLAGACPDTCCAGWEITVDPASERWYRQLRKQGRIRNREFAEKLKKYVKDGQIISEDVTCPFLDSNGLCEMYRELGPESLCHTCARHPRHLEDYGNLHEMVLLLSCPEVARLVLEENGDGFYVRELPEKQGNMDGIDEELLEYLLQIRELIWKIGRKDDMSINHRMAFSLALAHDVQRYLQTGNFYEVGRVLKRYEKDGSEKRFFAQWNGTGAEQKKTEDFARDFERDFERVFSYFIYSFFLGALYDRDALTKVKMAVWCTMRIEESYAGQSAVLTLETRVDICHTLARRIENCDEDRMELERRLKGRDFAARRMIHALL